MEITSIVRVKSLISQEKKKEQTIEYKDSKSSSSISIKMKEGHGPF